MDKDLKQNSHTKPYSSSSKRIATLSFLVAVQVASCASGRGQGFKGLTDQSRLDEGSFDFKKLQQNTANIVSEHFAERDAKLAKKHAQADFFKAIQACNLKRVKALLEDPLDGLFLPSKQIVEGLMLALNYKDTLSFRYKHEEIVHFLLGVLLEKYNVSAEDLSLKDQDGRTLLHLLIRRGDIYGVRRLVGKLPLKGLCAEDSKLRTPMHLAARYKSKKMFGILFNRIYKLDLVRAIQELFKKDKNGYAVIESSYLPKDRHFAGLFNNSHIQLPTFSRQGSEMFKYVLHILPVRLGYDQLVTIAIGVEEILEGRTICKGYAAILRSILTRYIEKKYDNEAKKVLQYVAYKRNRPYIEQQYGSDSKEVVSLLDEGYASA